MFSLFLKRIFVRGSIIVISGPSGSGKSTLLSEVFKKFDDLYFSISTTTRGPREGEVDGVDYHFADENDFEMGINDGLFIEWAKVHGNLYGTSLMPIKQALDDDKIVIFDIDVQGAKIIKEKLGNLVTSVFITTPNINILKQRLEDRGTDTTEQVERRLRNAMVEIERIYKYDYLIVNDQFEDSFEKFVSIVNTSRMKTSCIDTHRFIKTWEKGE
jgi:guanylate kinase